MYTTHHPCWDAKNRHGLESELPFDYKYVANIFDNFEPQNQTPVKLNQTEQIEREIDRKILAYQDTKEKGEIFKTVAEEWLDEYLLNTPYTTFKKCGKSAYLSLLQEFGNERIKNITSHDVDIFLKRLAAKDYAQKTVATYKSVFNQIFKFAG